MFVLFNRKVYAGRCSLAVSVCLLAAAVVPAQPEPLATAARLVLDNSSSAGRSAKPKEGNGVLVERVSLSAGGIMVDVRYRITDLAKAQQVLNRNSRLQLIDQKSKLILPVPETPKVGKLRQIPKTDDPARVYWLFFRNINGVAKPGSKLTLVLGDASIRDLIVE